MRNERMGKRRMKITNRTTNKQTKIGFYLGIRDKAKVTGFASVPFFIFPFSVLRMSTSSFLAQKLFDLSLWEPNGETVTKDRNMYSYKLKDEYHSLHGTTFCFTCVFCRIFP